MIEKIVLDYLTNKITDIPIKTENSTANEYVLIEKTGSSEENHIWESTIAIQSYSDSLYNAALLNERVKTVLLGNGSTDFGIEETDDVIRCSLNSDYNYTDTMTKQYRYQAIYDIKHY